MEAISTLDLANIKKALRFSDIDKDFEGFMPFNAYIAELKSLNPVKTLVSDRVVVICKVMGLATTLRKNVKRVIFVPPSLGMVATKLKSKMAKGTAAKAEASKKAAGSSCFSRARK